MIDIKPGTLFRKFFQRDYIVAAACGAFVAAMVGAAYAAVPFYNWFCRTTGYGGATVVSEVAPTRVLDRTVRVLFDSNTTGALPWSFTPDQRSVDVKIGQVVTIGYTIANYSARTVTAQASYNVTPPQAGAYFSKINCFCFTEQTLKPGETRDMTVVFFVDPSMVKDADQDDLNTITLSYTMYPVRDPAPVAGSEKNPRERS